ncbi:hypothetical protein AB0J82_39180 [Asanoa sp. NPDC049518]|uniref:hypothetical protein n=1 Tax=unclassified Asanoa TaxID=2685164 RepID=UPI003433BEC5
MSQPTASQVVALLGIDPDSLPLAPIDNIAVAGGPARCVRCGDHGQVMLLANTALGHRRVDLCDRCFRWATAPR